MIDPAHFKEDFEHRYKVKPLIFSAPGRVNLIGEHTDYNEGFVLPFAIDQRTFAAISPRSDGVFCVTTRTLGRTVEFRIGDPLPDEMDWSVYVRGMAISLQRKV